MSKRKELAFINKFGQTINVGDQVAVVVEGYSHRIRSYQGTYVGYVEYEDYNYSQRAQVLTYADGWSARESKKSRIATLNRNLIFPLYKKE